MTIEAVLIKMLDIYVSNFLIGLGYATAAGIFALFVERHMDKRDAREAERIRSRSKTRLED